MNLNETVKIDLQGRTAEWLCDGAAAAIVRMEDARKAINLCRIDRRDMIDLLNTGYPVPNEDITELNCALGRLLDYAQDMLEALALIAAAPLRHNHVTRDIKPRGVCPACDTYCQSGQTDPENTNLHARLADAQQSPTVRRNRNRRTSA